MKLIKQWREGWKLSSIQTTLLLALLSGTYAFLPALREVIPVEWYAVAMVGGNLLIAVVRLISQGITDK